MATLTAASPQWVLSRPQINSLPTRCRSAQSPLYIVPVNLDPSFPRLHKGEDTLTDFQFFAGKLNQAAHLPVAPGDQHQHVPLAVTVEAPQDAVGMADDRRRDPGLHHVDQAMAGLVHWAD